MNAFNYYGGKQSMISDILPLLPDCDHYCEPFAGSLAILLNRRPSPIETANDLNGDIANFFRVLRRSGRRFVKELQLMPYSREEFEAAWEETDDNFERALRFFVRVTMDIAKAGRKCDKSWASNVKYCQGEHSYAPFNFMRKVAGLQQVVARLKGVQIENRSAVKIIQKYDTPRTLFYCDPPYIHSTRTSKKDYKHEMSLEDHYELASVLRKCKGMVAVSGYESPDTATMYAGWKKIAFDPKQVPMSRGNGLVRQECLWLNYDPAEKQGQLKLF